MLSELEKFSAFYQSKHNLFSDVDHVTGLLTNLIQNQFVQMAIRDSEPIGFIVGVLSDHIFNPSIKVFTEFAWWVEEKSRMSKAGLLLLNDFIEYGKANAMWINFTLEEHSPVKGSFLERKGFALKERCFVMEV